jgi:hypothetical protein
MSITPMDGSLLVATTGRHLARCIGEALYASYSGQVEYHYRASDGMVQVVWSHGSMDATTYLTSPAAAPLRSSFGSGE